MVYKLLRNSLCLLGYWLFLAIFVMLKRTSIPRTAIAKTTENDVRWP